MERTLLIDVRQQFGDVRVWLQRGKIFLQARG